MKRLIAVLLAAPVVAVFVAGAVGAQAPDPGAVDRGRYMFAAGGCAECHTTGEGAARQVGAGGRALATPFGTFYGPNITPDPTHGIGRWSESDFLRAMRDGVRPDGAYYFPVFPYPSYSGMTDQDMRDIFAYVRTLAPVAQPSRPHDVGFPFNLRFVQFFWRLLFFARGPYQPDRSQSAEWNRGAYLANAVAHCQECHTPRNFLGALRPSMAFAGQRDGPGSGGRTVPNITPDRTTGIGSWTAGDLAEYLHTGDTPDGTSAAGEMAAVIRGVTSQMTAEDRRAIVVYLRSVRPVANDPRRRPGS